MRGGDLFIFSEDYMFLFCAFRLGPAPPRQRLKVKPAASPLGHWRWNCSAMTGFTAEASTVTPANWRNASKRRGRKVHFVVSTHGCWLRAVQSTSTASG